MKTINLMTRERTSTAWLIISIFVLVAVCWVIILSSLSYRSAAANDSIAYGHCLETGFPEVIKHEDLYYCVKSVDGTDRVIRLSKILDYPYNYMDE